MSMILADTSSRFESHECCVIRTVASDPYQAGTLQTSGSSSVDEENTKGG